MGWWWVTEERRAYLKEGASEVELWEEEIFSPSPSKLQTDSNSQNYNNNNKNTNTNTNI